MSSEADRFRGKVAVERSYITCTPALSAESSYILHPLRRGPIIIIVIFVRPQFPRIIPLDIGSPLCSFTRCSSVRRLIVV